MLQRISLPKLSVDPDGRCASMQLTVNSVAIIPFHAGDLASEENILGNDDVQPIRYTFVKCILPFTFFKSLEFQWKGTSCHKLQS